jgi:hypothetical protein
MTTFETILVAILVPVWIAGMIAFTWKFTLKK